MFTSFDSNAGSADKKRSGKPDHFWGFHCPKAKLQIIPFGSATFPQMCANRRDQTTKPHVSFLRVLSISPCRSLPAAPARSAAAGHGAASQRPPDKKNRRTNLTRPARLFCEGACVFMGCVCLFVCFPFLMCSCLFCIVIFWGERGGGGQRETTLPCL